MRAELWWQHQYVLDRESLIRYLQVKSLTLVKNPNHIWRLALVIDNVSFHHTEKMEQMCGDAGVNLVNPQLYSLEPKTIEKFSR